MNGSIRNSMKMIVSEIIVAVIACISGIRVPKVRMWTFSTLASSSLWLRVT
jgi:hypothetical protein